MKLLAAALVITFLLVLPYEVQYSPDSRFYLHASQTIGSGMLYPEHTFDRWMISYPPGGYFVAWTPLYPILLAIGQGFTSADVTVQIINVASIVGILVGLWTYLSGQKSLLSHP